MPSRRTARKDTNTRRKILGQEAGVENVAPVLENVDGKERLQVSIHTLQIAMDCRTRLLLRLAGLMDIGLPPPGSYVSMVAGSWMHKALAAWLTKEDWKVVLAPYKTMSEELAITEDRRGYDNLIAIMTEVVGRYPLARLPFEVLKPEISFVAPLGVLADGTPVDLIGYIDALVQDKRTGQRFILEHKTTGKLDEAFTRRFAEYDVQTTSYMLAAETVLGEKIGDAWVNAIEMAKVPSSDRKCNKHGVQYEECGPMHVKQAFIPARRTPEDLEEFRARALDICERYVLPVARALERRGPSVSTRTSRDGKFTGACDYCEYSRWCLTSNRSPNALNGMLKKAPQADDDRLRSGLVKVEAHGN